MHVHQSPADYGHWRRSLAPGTTVGFVPTMGALHSGHLSLLQQARSQCSVVVASVFVNPTQFDRANDLAAYPRMPEADTALLQEAGCHALLLPTEAGMYPHGTGRLQVHVPGLATVLEGASRPGHFDGVALVVAKLLNIVQPTHLYMGQKDLQQTRVVARMLQELFMPTQLVVCPTLREPDGLAMSSRNLNLTPGHRAQAPVLYQALQAVAKAWQQGSTANEALQQGHAVLATAPPCQTDYLLLVDADSLQPVETNHRPNRVAILVAAFFGQVRLIDNMVLE